MKSSRNTPEDSADHEEVLPRTQGDGVDDGYLTLVMAPKHAQTSAEIENMHSRLDSTQTHRVTTRLLTRWNWLTVAVTIPDELIETTSRQQREKQPGIRDEGLKTCREPYHIRWQVAVLWSHVIT
jgi:hypothetical protein